MPEHGQTLQLTPPPVATRGARRRPSTTNRTRALEITKEATEEQEDADRFGSRNLRHMPSQAFSASSAPPLTFHDLSAIYQVVSDRRNAYDNLLWQCETAGLLLQSQQADEDSQVQRLLSL